MITLYDKDSHKNVMFNDLFRGEVVQTNQHIVVDGSSALLLDPGGQRTFTDLLVRFQGMSPVKIENLKYLFFSHQDPDVFAGANNWLIYSTAKAFVPEIWLRFLPHAGLDPSVSQRIHPIPDEGMYLEIEDTTLQIIPAHFLHSPGNFHLYDPASKTLYSGDFAASFGCSLEAVDSVSSFKEHVSYMEEFHRRYMAGAAAIRHWLKLVENLDIEILAPQHGAVLISKEVVEHFMEWIAGLECGLDLLKDEE